MRGAKSLLCIGVVAGLVLSLGLFYPGFVAADEGRDTENLLKRIEELEKKVEVLTNRLSISEKAPAVTVPEEVIQKKVDDILAKREATEGGLVKALKDITLSGFIDTSYTYNFNAPDSRTNTARVFDWV